MKKYFFLLLILLNFLTYGQKEYYELRKYELPFNASEASLHKYFSEALIPALNRFGVENIGVFEALGKPTPKVIYLFIPYKNMTMYVQIFEALKKDKTYLNARATYDAVLPNKKVYNRFTTSFLIAFDGLPKLIKPKEATQLFELRTYEGYSEDAVRRKVDMFNKEEFSIFDATGLNSVFFGEQISGPLMPALTYMLAFESMEERNINWEKFSKNSEWKRVSILKEYSNTVSDIKRVFLKPLEYSQL